jgi:hypothetical protein
MDETIADASNIELYMMFTDFNKLRGFNRTRNKKKDEEPT